MPRAEPALPQVAPLHLPAVVGAATLRTGIITHVTPSGPPPRTADTGRVSWGPPSSYPWENPGADLALRPAHCHDTLPTRGPTGRTGKEVGDRRPDHNLGGKLYPSMTLPTAILFQVASLL